MGKQIKINPNGSGSEQKLFDLEWQKDMKARYNKQQMVAHWAAKGRECDEMERKLRDLHNVNRVSFVLMDKKDVRVAMPIVDFKNPITDEVLAAIGQDIQTRMPIVQILGGKNKGRRYRLDSRDLMQLVERLVKG